MVLLCAPWRRPKLSEMIVCWRIGGLVAIMCMMMTPTEIGAMPPARAVSLFGPGTLPLFGRFLVVSTAGGWGGSWCALEDWTRRAHISALVASSQTRDLTYHPFACWLPRIY